jgi:hypothetical protein
MEIVGRGGPATQWPRTNTRATSRNLLKISSKNLSSETLLDNFESLGLASSTGLKNEAYPAKVLK